MSVSSLPPSKEFSSVSEVKLMCRKQDIGESAVAFAFGVDMGAGTVRTDGERRFGDGEEGSRQGS